MDTIKNLADINPALENWINQEWRKGHNVTQHEIDLHRIDLIHLYNDTPNPDCHGFTPDQMSDMIYEPLEEGCPVQLRTLTEEEISQIPFMRQVLHLMNALSQKEIKLTQTGSLPMKTVEEIYDLGVKSKFSDYYKEQGKLREQRCLEVTMVREALEGAGLIKKRLGKLSLTERGKKLLKNPYKLFYHIFIYLFRDYNTAGKDGFEDYESGNLGQLYSLWLLHHYGSEWRKLIYYASDYYQAFDFEGDREAYMYRIFERLFCNLGLCEVREVKGGQRGYVTYMEARKTPLVEMIFSFTEPAKI